MDNNKRDNLRKQAEEAERESRIAAAEQAVEDAKAGVEEAEAAAENAMARDGGGISVDQPGPEAERTRILAETARQDLAEAEDRLKRAKEGENVEPQPTLQNAEAGVDDKRGSTKAATTTSNVNH